jgi:Mu transposase, C-terminal
VTARGIHFKKGYYSCETALIDDWFAKARQKTWTLTVSYDPRDLSVLYIHDPKSAKGFEICRLLDSSKDLTGISLFEAEEIDFDRRRIEVQGEDHRQAKRLVRDKRTEEIVRNAKRAKKAVVDSSVSKSEKVAEIRNNKAEEKELQQHSEKFDLRDSATKSDQIRQTEKSARSNDNYRDKELALLEAKRKQREGTL